MKEKERYVIRYDLDYNQCLIDTEKNQGVGDYIQIVKLLNQQDKRIKELEQENLSLQEQSIRDNQNWIEETTKLEQQLAEKDRQIEQLKKFDELNKTFFDLFRTAFKEPNKVDDLFNTLKTMQEKQDQDKISFALDVLKIAQDYIQQYVNDFDDKNDCLCAIDKLIKQLTHQHEDKGENK